MIVRFLQAVVAFLLVLAPLVFFHELGHFLVAKALRIGVPVFSLGFGPRLFGFRRRETDYRVSLVPLGGYVRLAGDESDEERSGKPEEFLSRPKHERLAVFVAGATFNLVLALLAMWLYFGLYGVEEVPERYPRVIAVAPASPAEHSGVLRGDTIVEIGGRDVKAAERFLEAYDLEVRLAPNTVRRLLVERDGRRIELGLETGEDPELRHGAPGWALSWVETPSIGSVVAGGAAERAGLVVGDRILAAGGVEAIDEVQLRELLERSPGRPIPLRVEREGRILELSVEPRDEGGKGRIGVAFQPAETVRRALSVTEAAMQSLRTNVQLSKTLFVVLKRLVTAELSLRTMSGPIGIAQVSRQALVSGFDAFLYLLGFFSLQLGILNLLPIPVLDGGHILILLVESVMRRDLSERLKERVMQAGLVFLVVFMSVILYLDVVKSL